MITRASTSNWSPGAKVATTTYIRAVLDDRVNLCANFAAMEAKYPPAVEPVRARRRSSMPGTLRADDKNAQIRVDRASLAWNLAAALLAPGR